MNIIKIQKVIYGIFLALLMLCLNGCSDSSSVKTGPDVNRPNILLIVADDLGYTDIEPFGGEINTPNINSLADEGLTLTNFYAASTCSPTRTMLLTGTDHHLVGMGTMNNRWDVNQLGKRGYETYLNEDGVTVASLLKDSGYHTYMTGKWHLGYKPQFQPQSRGFEKSFVLLDGAASHFNNPFGVVRTEKPQYVENGIAVELPENFYSSNNYTDKMIGYIEGGRDDNKPFFGYLAYTAPHWPLQVPDEDLDYYKGQYDLGYEHIREARIEKLKKLGIMDEKTISSIKPDYIESWDSLSQEEQKKEARKMEIYAAMVDNLDRNVGRVIEYLKETGQYENTFIFFMADNGAEGNDISQLADNKEWFLESFDNSVENMGRKNSYIYQGSEWARVSEGPYRDFKTFVSEGGIKVPAIVRFGDIPYKGNIDNKMFTVKDITPTLLELAGVTHPGNEYKGRKVYPITGRSALSHLKEIELDVHGQEVLHTWEFLGRQAVRKGDWKMVKQAPPYGQGQWELYDLALDPTETNNLSSQNPKKISELLSNWEEYKNNNNIIMGINGENIYAYPK